MIKVQQARWNKKEGWNFKKEEQLKKPLVFVFGERYALEDETRFKEVQEAYPNADIIINSTSGEIDDTLVRDGSIVLTALEFEKTNVEIKEVNINDFDNSFEAGVKLAESIQHQGLKHAFVISDGGKVNGSELVKGLNKCLPETVAVTGGLAGDAARFEKTLVGYNKAPKSGNIVIVGFYGEHLEIGYGSVGGWDTFGPRRKITKSDHNVLYELDGKSALELYKKYLGDKATGLPGTALLFPLSLHNDETGNSVVRTILSVDEEAQSMTFAGDLPEGSYAQLMKANFDRLVDGAYEAASSGKALMKTTAEPQISILISCVGRKLVLDQRIEEEIESVREVIGEKIPLTGFYSYGEISPFSGYINCELHNQTMTITLFSEN